MSMEFASIPAIAVICYVFSCLYKLIFSKLQTAYKFIPAINGVIGIGVGVLMFYLSPSIMSCNNVWDAVVVGFMSALGSTGVDQIVKQLVTKPIRESEQLGYDKAVAELKPIDFNSKNNETK